MAKELTSNPGEAVDPEQDKIAPIDQALITPEQRHLMIANAAYFHAEKRGFIDGDSLHDWLTAESEVEAQLNGSDSPGIAR